MYNADFTKQDFQVSGFFPDFRIFLIIISDRFTEFAYFSLTMKKILSMTIPLAVGILYKQTITSDMRFPTMWYVQPAKAQTSLRIHAV